MGPVKSVPTYHCNTHFGKLSKLIRLVSIKQKSDSLCLCLEGFIYFLLLVLGWLGVAWLIVSDLAMQKGIDQLPDTFDGY